MPDVTITDNVSLHADLKIRDDSPLAKAKPTQFVTTTKQLFADLDKPLDKADFNTVALGGMFTSPNLLSSDVDTLTFGAGMNCALKIRTAADKLVFPDDGFSPSIPIKANEAWLGVEFNLKTATIAGVSGSYFGVAVEADTAFGSATYTLFSAPAPPLPTLRQACATGFSNYSLTTSARAVREQLPNTVNVCDVSGAITLTLAGQQPFNLNALASANLPFNTALSIQPTVTLSISTAITVAGDFLVRAYKMSDSVLRIGVYKKRGTTLTVTLTGGAGIGGDVGGNDVIGPLLNAALPGVDVAAAGIKGDNAKNLNEVIKEGLNRSLSAQVNATCSAARTDEAAVVYEIQLNSGDAAATDQALNMAFKGDWTGLQKLGNAKRLRDIVVETTEKKQALTVNLLGFYSATSVVDYLHSCTVLIDDTGHMTITDKLDASRVSASTTPYAADTEKLRVALMQDFLCTATYAAMSGKLNLKLTVMQTYFEYDRSMSRDEMHKNILLGYALGVIPPGSLDQVLSQTAIFSQTIASASVRYESNSAMALFFKDPTAETPHSRLELEKVGRDVMCTLLDPTDSTEATRLRILKNDAAWKDMDEQGDTANFHLIASLAGLNAAELQDVAADWTDIVWWVKAMCNITPALNAAIAALKSAPVDDPTKDQEFVKARQHLANVLGAVTRDTNATFVRGWGEAVMFVLSGHRGIAQMDLTWNSQSRHFGVPA